MKILGLKDTPKTDWELFRVHFLLYHALYCLQLDLTQNKFGLILELDSVRIRLKRQKATEKNKVLQKNAITLPDPLATYYLDLKNLEETTPQEVEDLLTSFWNRFNSWDSQGVDLEVLGLEELPTEKELKSRFRRLIRENHPDHGGSGEGVNRICQAYQNLLALLRA